MPSERRREEMALSVAREIAAVPWNPEKPGQYLANVQNVARKALDSETERCAQVCDERAIEMRGNIEFWRSKGDENLATICANHAIILEAAAQAIREGGDGE